MTKALSELLTVLLLAALGAAAAGRTDTAEAAVADTASSTLRGSGRIRAIVLHGNRHTDSGLVHHFVAIDSGDLYDSTRIAAAQQRLRNTDLFTKAHVFPTFKPEGVDLHVIMVEAPRLAVSDLGAEFVEGRYGLQRFSDDWWLRAGFGLLDRNFGGRMERLRLKLGFFRDRHIHLSWSKQFVGTPYFVSLSAGAARRPDLHFPTDRFSLYQTTSVGRHIGRRARVYVTLMPSYSSRTRADLEPNQLKLPKVDAQGDTVYETKAGYYGVSGTPIPVESIPEESFEELQFIIGWSTALGNSRRWDPCDGARFAVTSRTNALWPRDSSHSYFQLDTDSRFYHQGFGEGAKFAYRVSTTTRLDTAGLYDGLYAGGLGGPRGWGDGTLGTGAAHVANNRVRASAEYRFPLFSTPTISFDRFARFHEGLRQFFYRVDGAFFADAAYLWHRLEDPFHDQSEWGLGLGVGIRVMAPTIERSGSLDFGWAIGPGPRWNAIKEWADQESARTRRYAEREADSGLERFGNRVKAAYQSAIPYLPAAHLYLDLPF